MCERREAVKRVRYVREGKDKRGIAKLEIRGDRENAGEGRGEGGTVEWDNPLQLGGMQKTHNAEGIMALARSLC